MVKTKTEVEKLEIILIKLRETQSLNCDDYNLISKYLAKVKNDLYRNN